MTSLTLDKVYEQIDEQRAVLIALLNQSKKNPISPNRLSDVCMKLSILNELLGGFIPDLKMIQMDREEETYRNIKAAGGSDTRASNEARLSSIVERNQYGKADMKHTDLWKLISMAQSHIRAEGEERKGM